MENIVTVTDKAINQLKQALADEKDAKVGIRIAIKGGGCSGYQYFMDTEDNPTGMDFTFDFSGVKIYIDPMSAPYLKGTTVDYITTLTQSGFTFRNPNAVKTCGCGQSFSA